MIILIFFFEIARMGWEHNIEDLSSRVHECVQTTVSALLSQYTRISTFST